MAFCDQVWLTAEGNLMLESAQYLAQIDDRDTAAALSQLYLHGHPASDEQILNWLDHPTDGLTFQMRGQSMPVRPGNLASLAKLHPFVASPARQNQPVPD